MGSERTDSYSSIFRATFLFGFVQLFGIAIKVVTSKVVAMLLGASGVGVIGLLNSTVRTLQSGAGLGISQSAVRDISEAYAKGDGEEFSVLLGRVAKIIVAVALLGVVVTLALAPWLSEWTFGDRSYTLSYVMLSLAVGFTILSESQLAILKGTRRLRAVALASLVGAVVGLCTSLPLIYLFGERGIAPSIIVASLSGFLASNYYVMRGKYTQQRVSMVEAFRSSRSMVVMGVSLMVVTFVGSLSAVVISSFVGRDGLDTLGYFQAGVTIINSYFGVITTAMTTDYYPRISAVHSDNSALKELANRQSIVNLTLALPLVVIFGCFSPLFLRVLYSADFTAAVPFLSYAIFGTILVLCSNNLEMILLAKQTPRVFLCSVIAQRLFSTVLCVLLFRWYGLVGLGIGFLMQGLVSLVVSLVIVSVRYGITLRWEVYRILIVVITLSVLAMIVKNIENYLLGTLLIIISVLIALRKFNETRKTTQ